MKFRSVAISCLVLVSLGLRTAVGNGFPQGEMERCYAASEEQMTRAYGLDRDFWRTLKGTLEEHKTVDGRAYGVMSSTVDFDMIQVCLWFSRDMDNKRLGMVLTQCYFQSLALNTVRAVDEASAEDVSLAAANLGRLGINYAELFRELCGAHGGFSLFDAGLRVKVFREENAHGCFYISQMEREEVCERLAAASERLKLKYDVPMLRLVSRMYLKRLLTYELSGHRMSKSHLRQTFWDLYGKQGREGILLKQYPGAIVELEALRLLAFGAWLKEKDLPISDRQREELRARMPAARVALGKVWHGIPIWWRVFLERGLQRVGEASFVQDMTAPAQHAGQRSGKEF